MNDAAEELVVTPEMLKELQDKLHKLDRKWVHVLTERVQEKYKRHKRFKVDKQRVYYVFLSRMKEEVTVNRVYTEGVRYLQEIQKEFCALKVEVDTIQNEIKNDSNGK